MRFLFLGCAAWASADADCAALAQKMYELNKVVGQTMSSDCTETARLMGIKMSSEIGAIAKSAESSCDGRREVIMKMSEASVMYLVGLLEWPHYYLNQLKSGAEIATLARIRDHSEYLISPRLRAQWI